MVSVNGALAQGLKDPGDISGVSRALGRKSSVVAGEQHVPLKFKVSDHTDPSPLTLCPFVRWCCVTPSAA